MLIGFGVKRIGQVELKTDKRRALQSGNFRRRLPLRNWQSHTRVVVDRSGSDISGENLTVWVIA
jgi:hypothetical protein